MSTPFNPLWSSDTCDTHTVRIWMAGDYNLARQITQEFCSNKGFCVSLSKQDYVYTGGQEKGFCATVINYPRFPSKPEAIDRAAAEIAHALCIGLGQGSYTIEGPERSTFYSRRKE